MTFAQDGKIAGYSLLEMLVVLAIAAMATGLLTGGLNAFREKQSAQAIASGVAEAMMVAHWRAIRTGEEQSVVIDLESHLAIDPKGKTTIDIPGGMEISVTIGKEILTDRKRLEVMFLPDGSSSGSVIILKKGDDIAALRTNWLTGLTELDR